MKARHVILYELLGLLAAGATALALELSQGHVPIPERYAWLVPVGVAMLTRLGMLLPQAGDRP